MIEAAARLALLALATARLTRFVTTDWLGEWWLVRPAKRWAQRHEAREIERRSESPRVEFDRAIFGDVVPEEASLLPSASVAPRHGRARGRRRKGTRPDVDHVFEEEHYGQPEPLPEYSEEPDPDNGWRSKLVHGLDCPFCVGFWIGGAVLVGEAVTRRAPRLRGAWTLALGALALNYLVGHVSSRIDQ